MKKKYHYGVSKFFYINLILFMLISFQHAFSLPVKKINLKPAVNTEEGTLFLVSNDINRERLKNKAASERLLVELTSFMMAAPTLDLNSITAGNDYDFQLQPAFAIYPTSVAPNITSDDGNIVSATINFSGLLDAGEEMYFNDPGGVVRYNFAAPTQTTSNHTFGGTTFKITLVGTTFTIEEATETNQPIPIVDFIDFLEVFFYADLSSPYTDGVRTMNVTITDTVGSTANAQTIIRVYTTPPIAVNDTNTIAANSVTTISGNVLTDGVNDSGATAISVTEVEVYPTVVGNVYTTLYGTITIQSNGSYVYDVDETNSSVTGLKNGESLFDIISYTIADTIGIKDYGYLTVEITGVDEAPSAFDNDDSLTAFVDASTIGNVITDIGGGGSDAVDRGLSTLVWENEFTDGETVNGKSKTVDLVGVSFITTDPGGFGTASNQIVTYGTNGGHTGYLLYNIDGTINPTDDTVLTINFTQPVYNLGFLLTDIDFSQGTSWQDQMKIEGNLSGVNSTYKYVTTGGVVDAGSNTFYGIGSAIPDDATGNVNVFFEEPINQLNL